MNNQIILLIDGPESSRKTTIALTCPGPLHILDVNKGLDIPEFDTAKKEIDIKVTTIPNPRGKGDAIKQAACEARDLFLDTVMISLETYPYTLVDTTTNIWEIFRLAEMGAYTVKDLEKEDKKKGQLNFEGPNFLMRQWLFYPYETGNHLIMTAHQGERYVGNRPSGEIIPRGFKDIPEIVKQHVRVTKDFTGEILKCRSHYRCVGKKIEEPCFRDLALLFYPDTDPEDWSVGM